LFSISKDTNGVTETQGGKLAGEHLKSPWTSDRKKREKTQPEKNRAKKAKDGRNHFYNLRGRLTRTKGRRQARKRTFSLLRWGGNSSLMVGVTSWVKAQNIPEKHNQSREEKPREGGTMNRAPVQGPSGKKRKEDGGGFRK